MTVGVEDVGPAVAGDRFFERGDAEVTFDCDKALYRRRHKIENLFARLKD